MKEGQGKEMADMRLTLPVLPGKDDIFTEMAKLFIDTYEDLVRAMEILKFESKDYVEARQADIEAMPMRYLEIIKEYQEQLFAQPVQKEGIEE
jgi:hypothetical protein